MSTKRYIIHNFLSCDTMELSANCSSFSCSLKSVSCCNETFVPEELPLGIHDSLFWIYLSVYAGLVLLAGIMSGLTMGLLSLDILTLKVLRSSGTDRQKKYASAIVTIVEKHHLLLVTLLLGNAAAVEAMPLFLDKISNPVVAVVVSVTAVLIFGEVIPQALCTRYGLAIGYYMSPFVKFLMVLLFIISWPIAKFLDIILGKEHSTFFRRAELKELVSIHGQKDPGNEEQLTYDEVLIIKGALEMRNKVVREVMTPIKSVFMISQDDHLDLKLMKMLVSAGHSRVPVYSGVRSNIIGLVLVKNLILLDPDDAVPVRDVCRPESALRPLPRVDHDMPLYTLLNEFQKGKSHMCQVWGPRSITTEDGDIEEVSVISNDDPKELIGVITLEDVIEELIQEEIIDETDVFVDVHRRILVARAKLSRSVSETEEKNLQEKIKEGAKKFYLSRRSRSMQERSSEENERAGESKRFSELRETSIGAADEIVDEDKPLLTNESLIQ
ncbi:uncharacterized protein [Oscarella lobularis]|uniref:uncharacterized protein n=1 Tax=Oscarella lobularis TaxID=121494 RepID=UPI003313777C